MQSKPWTDYLEESNNHHNDDNYIKLPQIEIIDLNTSGTLQKVISYQFDDNDANKIIRIEKIFHTVKIKRSIAAINRKKNWIKFGQCRNIKKGKIERGVTTQREGIFEFIWSDQKKRKSNAKTKTRNTQQKIQLLSEKEEKTVSNAYRAPNLRTNFEEETVDIKISNLPQWSEWNDIKQLIDSFKRKYLKQRYINKYKIVMIPSNKRLQEWSLNPVYFQKQLQEYDRMAIVEFENKQNAQKAIKILNGHRYEYNILQVEKARERNSIRTNNNNISNINLSNISRKLCSILRHQADKIGLNIRKDGYIKISDIFQLQDFKVSLTLQKLQLIVDQDTKNRFNLIYENNYWWIRANQGHSIKSINIQELASEITRNDIDKFPLICHGTYLNVWDSILEFGLNKMKRNNIHFIVSDDFTNKNVISGMRSDCEILIYINLLSALQDGIKFYLSKNKVVLSAGINGILSSKYFIKTMILENRKPTTLLWSNPLFQSNNNNNQKQKRKQEEK